MCLATLVLKMFNVKLILKSFQFKIQMTLE